MGTGATGSDVLSPQLVSGGFTDWKYVKVNSMHACGVRPSGAPYCWGENTYGQFGHGAASGAVHAPTEITGARMKTE